ncbi:MAG: hypothetical protein TREMPRED_002086 [Tremellales sp. Tagirdzhanova-0007]|nr:MAG: hypothetical protein TREMPRED_002086 [Tremellales sp. Tagirdzhanova-0007]
MSSEPNNTSNLSLSLFSDQTSEGSTTVAIGSKESISKESILAVLEKTFLWSDPEEVYEKRRIMSLLGLPDPTAASIEKTFESVMAELNSAGGEGASPGSPAGDEKPEAKPEA